MSDHTPPADEEPGPATAPRRTDGDLPGMVACAGKASQASRRQEGRFFGFVPATPNGGPALMANIEARLRAGLDTEVRGTKDDESLSLTSNKVRVMVILFLDNGHEWHQAVEFPPSSGASGGFLLFNGQMDEYENADTVELATALEIVASLIYPGRAPAQVAWISERA